MMCQEKINQYKTLQTQFGVNMEILFNIIIITGIISFIIYKKKPEWIELVKSKIKK